MGLIILGGCTHPVPPAPIDQTPSASCWARLCSSTGHLVGPSYIEISMSFTAPIVPPHAPPPWAHQRQTTVVYHEVAFFCAGDDPQTIVNFWDSFLKDCGCGIEYGRQIHTEITWPGWHVYNGTYWFDYRPYLNRGDPTHITISRNEDNRFSFILKHRVVSKSPMTAHHLLRHAELRRAQLGDEIRVMGVSSNTRHPLLSLSQGGSCNQSWRHELSEDQDEDFSTQEDLNQWQHAANIPNAIAGNNANGSSHDVTH